MIKFVPLEVVLPLRSKMLRNGAAINECVFPTDEAEGIFHLAYYADEAEIATVATFYPQDMEGRNGRGYQLRGMATDTAFLGKGYGAMLIKYAVDYIKEAKAEYIWCNARTSAVDFYKKQGFEIVSEEFEIPGVGPHYIMILNLI
ncbi:GNAT family N-acetyltransferase [Pedobacter xixiisoli]|uniref:Predicted N-acyltransferase, GNAT family n=1 Tax=Pedobacter xixiisoli TaxID=1476464 RepID=A0A286A9V1_9SPHI|nr:GNAT family N-acetyltransferase [Pedobacter xixiisoli]SOD18684.1 Predicted N-acyltransferase, GNAT family [Pedobacter xixiisoli]